MEDRMPAVIDLNAEAAKLTMFRGLTPQTKRGERKGSAAHLPPYRGGILLLGKSAGTSHWETHPEDELVHVLDGTKSLDIVCDDGPPKSFELRAGMIVIVPQGAWHRVCSAEGGTTFSATIPGDHVESDVDDPRKGTPGLDLGAMRAPSIIDLNAELARLVMFRGRTPRSTMADRKDSSVRLAAYRDGALSLTKFAGKGHWESHVADELIHVLDGSATLEMVGEEGPRSFTLSAGMIAVNPRGTWHRFSSADGVALLAVTPSPSEVIDLDVDDPRQVERKPA
jgi:quercetin dioxygenase-like cupin family protein